jgi:hypothetical protein
MIPVPCKQSNQSFVLTNSALKPWIERMLYVNVLACVCGWLISRASVQETNPTEVEKPKSLELSTPLPGRLAARSQMIDRLQFSVKVVKNIPSTLPSASFVHQRPSPAASPTSICELAVGLTHIQRLIPNITLPSPLDSSGRPVSQA